MLFLIDDDNPEAKFFLQAGIIFAVAFLMLCFIFAPVVYQKTQSAKESSTRSRHSNGSDYGASIAGKSSSFQYSIRDSNRVHVTGISPNGNTNRSSFVGTKSILHELSEELQEMEQDDEEQKRISQQPPESALRSSRSSLDSSFQAEDPTSGPLEPVTEDAEGEEMASALSLPSLEQDENYSRRASEPNDSELTRSSKNDNNIMRRTDCEKRVSVNEYDEPPPRRMLPSEVESSQRVLETDMVETSASQSSAEDSLAKQPAPPSNPFFFV
jgi:hypothetical protein